MPANITVKFNWRTRTRSEKGITDLSSREPGSTAKRPESAAGRSRRKLKENNAEGYTTYLNRDAERKKITYALNSDRMSDLEKENRRKMWTERKKEQRKKNKAKQAESSNNKTSYKAMSKEEKREYMVTKKRESRRQMSSQKTVINRTRETKRRRLAREEEQMTNMQREEDFNHTPSRPASLKSPPSERTLRRKAAKVKEVLPSTPTTFAMVMSNLVEKASPLKKAELEKRGVKRKLEDTLVMASLDMTIRETRTNMTEEKHQHYNVIAYACQRGSSKAKLLSSLGIGRKVQKKMKTVTRQTELRAALSRKRRRDAISTETARKVKEHWTSETTSRIVPFKKRVKKGQPLYVLECTYIQAYRAFKAANPDVKIGYVSFIQMKPSYVRHLKALERSVCCCIKCAAEVECTKQACQARNGH